MTTATAIPAPRDTAARRLTAGAVLGVAGIAAVVSFVHIQQVALDHGQSPLAAFLLPFSIDGTVVAASSAMLRAARAGLGTPRMGRFMLVLAVLATLACNVAYGLPYGVAGALISGWPAVAFIGCAELAIGMARKLRPAAPHTDRTGRGDRLRRRLPRRFRADVETGPETTVTTPKATAKTVPTSAVASAPAATPKTGPRPVPPRPRDRSRTPVDAEREFAEDLAAGRVPGTKRIKTRMHVGYDRAREIQEHLEQIAGERVAA